VRLSEPETMKLILKQTNPGNLPYISLYHGTNLYNFLVDTGSTSNWIDPKVMFNFMQEGESRVGTRTLNGENYKTLIATLRVEPRVYTEKDDTAYKFRASFASGFLENLEQLNNNVNCKMHGILGMEFLQENGSDIDLKTLTMII